MMITLDDVSSCAWWSFNRDTFICDTLTSCSLNAQSTSWESGASTCQDSDDGDCLQNGSCVGTIVESDTDIVTSDECLSVIPLTYVLFYVRERA